MLEEKQLAGELTPEKVDEPVQTASLGNNIDRTANVDEK